MTYSIDPPPNCVSGWCGNFAMPGSQHCLHCAPQKPFRPKCDNVSCGKLRIEGSNYCVECSYERNRPAKQTLSAKYPKYYKAVGELTEVDVYAVHKLFDIQDPSGAIQHASKKLLLSGVRTGGKSKADDIREARDTLNRWLELHKG